MFDVAVAGAGPAGLAAATSARLLGAEVLLIEQGKPIDERLRDYPADAVSGLGGAGLFSDGKFSFFPSATALWGIQPESSLLLGYKWLEAILADHGLVVPEFPREHPDGQYKQAMIRRKEYPSYYLSFADRLNILRGLVSKLDDCLCLPCDIMAFQQTGNGVRILDNCGRPVAEARSLVLALGRYGAVTIQRSLAAADLAYRRVELGIRIEQPADAFIFRDDPCLDPKLIGGENREYSWRTFCCCREGVVIFASSGGISAVSGRADCPATGYSNIGFLVRFSAAAAGMTAWREALRVQPISHPLVASMTDIMDRTGQIASENDILQSLGAGAARHVASGLNDLTKFIGRPLDSAVLYAPAIEGVGLYPRIDLNLRIPGRPIFVAGDMTGKFRGLTAALLSGYVAGVSATTEALNLTIKGGRSEA